MASSVDDVLLPVDWEHFELWEGPLLAFLGAFRAADPIRLILPYARGEIDPEQAALRINRITQEAGLSLDECADLELIEIGGVAELQSLAVGALAVIVAPGHDAAWASGLPVRIRPVCGPADLADLAGPTPLADPAETADLAAQIGLLAPAERARVATFIHLLRSLR